MEDRWIQIDKKVIMCEHIVRAEKGQAINTTSGLPLGWYYVRLTFVDGKQVEFQKEEATILWDFLTSASFPLVEETK